MSTEKQIIANKENAMHSTGPNTPEGKAIVATNPTKHGIFTKDLIITTALGKENEEEYTEMLDNLIECLSPRNQMESLLVEKIAIDFWRLRRVMRFEGGSIAKHIESIYNEFYSYGKKNTEELQAEIQRLQEHVDWVTDYLECLKRGAVSFEKSSWEGEDIDSDILEGFLLILKTLKGIPYEEKQGLLYGNRDFVKLKGILAQHGYSSKNKISTKLIQIYEEEIQRLEKEIEEQEDKILTNIKADHLNIMLGLVPQEENSNKILKYERSIQKSVFQNLFLLKKLQGFC